MIHGNLGRQAEVVLASSVHCQVTSPPQHCPLGSQSLRVTHTGRVGVAPHVLEGGVSEESSIKT